MGNANSRQKLTQPFRNALVALLERTKIRDGFHILLERIKGITGFYQGRPQTEPTSSQGAEEPCLTSYQASVSDHRQHEQSLDGNYEAEPSVAEHRIIASPDHQGCTSTSEAEITGYDGHATTAAHVSVKSRIKDNGPDGQQPSTDLEEHPPQSNNRMDDEDSDDSSIVGNIKDAIEAAVPVLAIRKAYETRMNALDAVYSRIVPDFDLSLRPERPKLERASSGPKKPPQDRNSWSEGSPQALNVQKDPTIDRWIDTEAAEYVFSSLEVALPEGELSNTDATIVFQRSQSVDTPVQNAITPINGPEAHEPTSNDSRNAPSRTLWSKDEMEALTNYHWHRTVYLKLPLEQNSIRLVNIQPGEYAADVSVIITVHSLDKDAVQYEALSYVWGDPKPAKHITVNGRENVPVNPNLFDALVSLRQTDAPRCIWIDALCLNQESPAEKSKQVQKMGKIYGFAKTVNVFLGVSSSSNPSSIEVLFQFLEDINATLENGGLMSHTFEQFCGISKSSPDNVCRGFVELCLQPWWGRIWTLQEFYLAKDEPVWYWGRKSVNNILFKKYFSWLSRVLERRIASGEIRDTALSNIESIILRSRSVRTFRLDVERAEALVWSRYDTDGFDSPTRLYRGLSARATNPRDVVYGLRAIFDPVFGKVFIPDYQMRTEVLFACLAVFLVQFECWGDVLWYYPARFHPGKDDYPSWLPDFTKHIQPHELDMQPLYEINKAPTPKLVVMNHRLHAEGYVLDKVYGHRHLHWNDDQKMFEELWQYDHGLNNNHECHQYFQENASSEDVWLKALIDMYESFYAKWTHFNSAFRGAVLQSTIRQEDRDKLPSQITECVPHWDLLKWHADRTVVPGLFEAISDLQIEDGPGCLQNIFSLRLDAIFQRTFADFFIGACIFDWNHLEIWLRRFSEAKQWAEWNHGYWYDIRNTWPGQGREWVISVAYTAYENDIWPEVHRVTWCSSFYYSFLAYAILLESGSHQHLTTVIEKLQKAANILRHAYTSTPSSQIRNLAATSPVAAIRLNHYNTVVELFRGRYYLWTDGGFRGISCPGVEVCCDEKAIVAIVDGLSFPVIVPDFNEATGEGWLAGCAVMRGVNMLSMDTEAAELPPDYQKGKKRLFKFR